tara:strand:- start:94 stop:483 length:390 start_codon:yes stop_codon:yes gene_type:complete
MAAPTPVTNLYKNGKAFVSSWRGVWAGTGDFTDTIIVNLSDLNYTNRIRILNIAITATTGISAELEFEGSTDALIYHHPIGIGETAYLDFTPIGGLIWDGQTDTGDIVLTTLSAASADVVSIVVTGRCS